VLAQLLRSAGCDVAAVESGGQAVQLLGAPDEKFDLVFVDILMPDMDGFETAEMIQALPGQKALRLIAMSAAPFAHDQNRYTAAGFSQVLAKPIACKSLYSCVASTLGVNFAFDSESISNEQWSLEAAIRQASALPADLRDRLREAAELCSVTDLRDCAHEIESRQCHDLARLLRQSLQNFDFSGIDPLLRPATAAVGKP
jgi:CheY-like chemotaxis protein